MGGRSLQNSLEDKIKEFLIGKLSPFLIVVFGSTVKGTTRIDSDIDIAYLSDIQYADYDLFLIKEELASLLNKDVDLIDLKNATTVFQAQIITSGKVIYCTDQHKRMAFELLTLKKYVKLNEERQVVIDKITESGSVYNEK